jgi:transposase InsO family protein
MVDTANALIKALNLHPQPHTLISDNSSEFCGHVFQEVLKTRGITWWHTEPYTPEQNGKMERWWGTLE